MTNGLLTAVITVMAVLAWVSVFGVIPSCARSFYRYRLWRLRDLLVDEISAGVYRDAQQPQLLVREIELGIRFASHLTFARLILLRVSRGRAKLPQRPAMFDLAATHADDRGRLGLRHMELVLAMRKQALVGSPSGWLVTGILFPVFFVLTAASRISLHTAVGVLIEQTKTRTRAAVPEPEFALRMLGARPETHHISRFAH